MSVCPSQFLSPQPPRCRPIIQILIGNEKSQLQSIRSAPTDGGGDAHRYFVGDGFESC